MPQPDLARLKALLFGDEARRLRDVETRLAALESGPARSDRAPGAPKPLGFALTRAIVAAGLLVILALLLREPFAHYRKAAEIEAALAAAKAADARLLPYPLSVSEDWRAGTVSLDGFAPSREALDGLLTALTAAAAPMRLVAHVETLAPSGGAGLADLAAALARQAGRLAEMERRLAALEKAPPPPAAAKAAEGQGLTDLAAALARQEGRLKEIAERLAAIETAGAALGADAEQRLAAAKGALDAEIAELRGDEARLNQALAGADAKAKDQDARIRRLEARLADFSSPGRAYTPRPAAAPLVEAAAATRALGARVADARAKAAALSAAIACIRSPADLPGVQSRAAALVGALDAAMTGAANAQTALAAKAAEAEARDLAAETRIAFAEGDALADPAAAAVALDRLAAALARARLGVRVLALAAPADPAALAPARAAKIADMLVKRGVPAAAAVPADQPAKPGETAGVVFEPLTP